MDAIKTLRTRREAILAEMRSLETMRRGTINEQYFQRGQKSGESTSRRGPYYVLSRREDGRTVSRRLKTAKVLEKARESITAHKRFLALCEEFVSTTERLGDLVERDSDLEQKKKRRRSPSSETRK